MYVKKNKYIIRQKTEKKEQMLTYFYLVSLAALTNASLSVCEQGISLLPVHYAEIDPPQIVAKGQPVHLRISYSVPPNLHIPSVRFVMTSYLNGFAMPTQKAKNLHSLKPDTYHYNDTFIFPSGIWGRLNVKFKMLNVSGEHLICLNWIVFATNGVKNETSWISNLGGFTP